MKATMLLIFGFLVMGCSLAPRDNSRPLERYIVGQWEWEEGTADCTNLVNIAFKSNGTYTRTSESCDFADDGFGNFYYGWYVANDHICFVDIKEQFENEAQNKVLYKQLYNEEKNKGFDPKNCLWKIAKIGDSEISIVETNNKGQSTSFVMVRHRWL